jgi:NADH-quinone oxidoreductase subunit L
MFAAEAEAVTLSSGWFLENAWLIGVIPAIGFAIILFFGKRLPMGGSEVGIASMAASLALSIGTAIQWMQRTDSAASHSEGALGTVAGFARSVFPGAAEGGEVEPFIDPVIRKWTWWQSGNLEFGVGQHIDGLAVMLLFLVAFISLLVQIFSIDYVRGDRRYTHFFASLTLFSAGMLVMVSAENMVQIILGWEIMGLCSFLLIGHWWEDKANSRAALKAFFTVRVGDVGLLVGTAIIFFGANQWAIDNLDSNGFSVHAISAWALSGDASATVLTWGAIALFIACIGKSGQFPLHTWLPDAMAGPTPVSSLLHSSTMVVAGVFLVARLFPVFWEGLSIGPGDINLIAIIGTITLVIAAFLAFVQHDIKKVLAYSTVSQLGYMMLGLGTGAWLPAVFHIFTHAFFKCCLFLCAGSVSHSGSHHSFDMKKDMGGLAKKMPVTAAAWIVSTLALAGVFPLSGFFSKDEIIDNVGNNGYTVFMWISLGGAFLTAAYMVRATYLTFFGEPRGAAAGEHHDPHDPAYAHGEEHALDAIEEHEAELVHAGHGHAAHDGHDAHGHDAHGHDAHGGGHDDHGHDAHHGPHESGPLILVPIVILAFLALTSGLVNAVPFGENWENFKKYVEPRAVAISLEDARVTAAGVGEALVVDVPAAAPAATASEDACGFAAPEEGYACFFPAVSHAEFKWSKAAISLAIVAAGLISSWAFCVAYYTKRNRFLVGLTERNKLADAGYQFLWNKYYLDHLYEKVIVHGVAHPIAKGAYWINQHVIDAVVNAAGTGGRRTGEWVYRNLDQRVVDGAVNASGMVASEAGHALQPVQSGRVNLYGALLFSAAAVGAIVLVILNV